MAPPPSAAVAPTAFRLSYCQGEQLLAKYDMIIQGLRGERVIRRNATYEVDPLTRRINRFVLTVLLFGPLHREQGGEAREFAAGVT